MDVISFLNDEDQAVDGKEPSVPFLDKVWNDTKMRIILLMSAFFFLFPICFCFLPIYNSNKKIYLQIKKLHDLGDDKTLLSIVQEEKEKNNTKLLLSIAALVDRQNKEVRKIIHDKLEEISDLRIVSGWTYTGVRAHLVDMYFTMEKSIQTKENKNEEKKSGSPSRIYKRIPITKVYLLDKKPNNEKCMITKIALDFEKDIIFACPNCGNFAKKELLQQWLQTNNICPICKKKLDIDNCPLVLIKPKNERVEGG